MELEMHKPVWVDNGTFSGAGVICGVATTFVPPIGYSYIVKITDGSLPSSEYPYDTIVTPECYIKLYSGS